MPSAFRIAGCPKYQTIFTEVQRFGRTHKQILGKRCIFAYRETLFVSQTHPSGQETAFPAPSGPDRYL